MNKRKRAAKRKATKRHKRGIDELEIMAKSLLGQPITSFRGQPITEADLRRIGIDIKEVMAEWDKKYKHQANRTLRRKAKEGLLTYKPSTVWHSWLGTEKKEGSG